MCWPECGTKAEGDAKFCMECGRSLKMRPAVGSTEQLRQNISSVELESALSGSQPPLHVRPWVRLLARGVDFALFLLLCDMFVILCAIIAPHTLPQTDGKIFLHLLVLKQTYPLLYLILVGAIWILPETWLLTAFSTTPGKWLFKIKIEHQNGLRIPPSAAFARSFKVWWYGQAAGIPGISLLTYCIAYRRLTRNSITSWDKEERFIISHQVLGLARIIVILLVILLATTFNEAIHQLLVTRLIARTDDAMRAATKVQISNIENALQLYKLDNGYMPSTEQGLKALVERPQSGPTASNWKRGGYLSKVPVDPWGRDYTYTAPSTRGGEYEIISFGADGKPGGDGKNADIVSWDLDRS